MALSAILELEFCRPDLKKDDPGRFRTIENAIVLRKKLKKSREWSIFRTIGRLFPIIFIIFYYFYFFINFFLNNRPIVLKREKR